MPKGRYLYHYLQLKSDFIYYYKTMGIGIDYLNNKREVRHIFTDADNCGRELEQIIKQGATDIYIYKL